MTPRGTSHASRIGPPCRANDRTAPRRTARAPVLVRHASREYGAHAPPTQLIHAVPSHRAAFRAHHADEPHHALSHALSHAPHHAPHHAPYPRAAPTRRTTRRTHALSHVPHARAARTHAPQPRPSSARISAACRWFSRCCRSSRVSASTSSTSPPPPPPPAPPSSSSSSGSSARGLGFGTCLAYSLAFWRLERVPPGAADRSAGCRSSSCCLLITRRFLEKSLTRSAFARFATSSSDCRSGLSAPSLTYSLETLPVYGLYSARPRSRIELSAV
mmetsp:Transcript_30154/g.78273  ORF Transcript_30154/g.78273 Transcript_30154/m.78273 type:complete len:274 (+) Transcript_30154:200-1021(+)